MMTSPETLTADDLARLKVLDKRTELVGGRLVVREPAGFQHGVIAARVTRRMEEYVATHDLGVVVAAETGFKLSTNPDTVRAPDAGFIAKARIPDPLPRGYLPLAPDLAVEVLSPDDRPGDVLSKVAEWLNAGSALVWVIDPQQRIARVYRENGTESLVREAGELDGENVVAGFALPLRTIL
jgi:Uma2 family endonuclease